MNKTNRSDLVREGSYLLSTLGNISLKVNEPVKFKDAWEHQNPCEQEKWKQAINKEKFDLQDRKVWDIVENNGQRVIPLKLIFKIKSDGRYRARLVALGYRQVSGLDYEDIHSPVISDVGFRMILCICLKNNWVYPRLMLRLPFC